MPTHLIVETYQVVAGASAADPAAVVLTPSYRERRRATELLQQLTQASSDGVITVSGQLFVRPTPGQQLHPISDTPTAASIAADLVDKKVQVVLFARVTDGTVTHVRLGSAPATLLAQLDP